MKSTSAPLVEYEKCIIDCPALIEGCRDRTREASLRAP